MLISDHEKISTEYCVVDNRLLPTLPPPMTHFCSGICVNLLMPSHDIMCFRCQQSICFVFAIQDHVEVGSITTRSASQALRRPSQALRPPSPAMGLSQIGSFQTSIMGLLRICEAGRCSGRGHHHNSWVSGNKTSFGAMRPFSQATGPSYQAMGPSCQAMRPSCQAMRPSCQAMRPSQSSRFRVSTTALLRLCEPGPRRRICQYHRS